jgi:hypothetical protein
MFKQQSLLIVNFRERLLSYVTVTKLGCSWENSAGNPWFVTAAEGVNNRGIWTVASAGGLVTDVFDLEFGMLL